ncbi:BON domain-containing protein [Paraburkholderia diazotrophica]|uniref:Osmotically-inducible protein OsmY, contains BON domain n=1 Tax=Paraburkholderia diazotrophica TaxID=667676 RepID=A0A1H7EJL8_9BURK|nr:BON domain-containing protein [Paraburkholderia diazotrophica]SEK10865.1 Osmotically-inducible protein OsmY, contains BON domain [Paraburkholderia diazotrophica]
MKSDVQLKKEVEQELEWDLSINAAGVGVEVHDRIVTLAGHLSSFAEKLAARRAAQRVEGVKGVVVELDVRVPSHDKRTDEEIAASVRSVLEWTAGLSERAVQVTVESGCVTLSGEVDWGYQMKAAENAVVPLRGVVSVVNQINVRGNASARDIAGEISAALKRHAEDEARHIDVAVSDGTVTLRGKAGSFPERSIICAAAWSAPGVRNVVDQLSIGA